MTTLDFPLNGDHIELHALLKLTGLCDSGGAGKALVARGVVQVDGHLETRKRAKIRAGQIVSLPEIHIRVIAA